MGKGKEDYSANGGRDLDERHLIWRIVLDINIESETILANLDKSAA